MAPPHYPIAGRLTLVALSLSFFLPFLSPAQSADNAPKKGHYIEFGIGYQFQRFKDVRHSSIYRNAGGMNLRLGYRAINEKRQHAVGINFSNTNSNQEFASFASNILGGLYYEHLRKINTSIWLGGYYDLGAFYGNRGGEWQEASGNFTWAAWSSLGLSASLRKNVGNGWSIDPSVRLPLLAYTVRPAYNFPYPETYLQDGRFSFIEEGMTKEAIKSGKFQTITNFMNLQLACGIHKSFSNRGHQIGIQYQTGYLFFNGEKPFADWQNQISIISKFNLSK